jgi:uncharacterized protein (TIGR02597 family)
MPTNARWKLGVRALAIGSLAGFLFGVTCVRAAATSEPVGFSTVTLAPASDRFVSVLFLRPAVFAGTISSVTGNVVSLSGAPGWSPAQFVYAAGSQPNTYFVLLGSGAGEGRSFAITGNGTNTLDLDLTSGSLAGAAAGDALRIVPYWTLGTLFPPAAAGVSFTPTTDVNSLQTVVSLFIPRVGINPVPGAAFFHFSGAWRQTGQSISSNKDDQVVGLNSPIKIRNAGTGGVLVLAGSVVMQKLALPIATQMGGQQDNLVALARPVPLTLNESGLGAGGAFAASANALVRSDLVMVTDYSVPGMNDAASVFYIYYNSGWRKLGQPLTADFGSDVVFDSTKAVSIRTGPSSDGATRTWINAATY